MGLAVGIMWTIYIIVVFILWAIFSRFIKRRLYKNLFIAFFILLPTWDALIQKGLKTYFELFELEPTIYSYPQRDKNNKIESLGLINVETLNFNDFENASEEISVLKSEDLFSPDIQRNVADFVEIDSFGGYLNHKQLPNYPIRITFTKSGYSVEKITAQKARYQIQAKIEDKLLGFYSKKDFLLVDTKTKKVLAKAVAFYFPNHRWYAWFRDDVLFNGDMLDWETPPPIVCVQGDVSNLDEMLKKALNIKMYTIKHKGFKND